MTVDDNNLVLVDGSGYIFRAYYALPPMFRSDGLPVNAVFGFTNMLLKLIEDIQSTKYPLNNTDELTVKKKMLYSMSQELDGKNKDTLR